jgi:glycosyltransferase involved in cell wall biosynthesis
MGGAETQMTGLVRLLKEKNYEVDMVKYHSHNVYTQMLSEANIQCITLDVKNRWDKLFAVRRFIKSRGGFDCVIAFKDGPTIMGCLLKILGGKFNLIVSERRVTLVNNLHSKIKFFLYRWADKVVPNSYTQADLISRLYPSLRDKVEVITNFTNVEHYSPLDKPISSPIRILTAARISVDKNILNYLSAIRILKDKGVNVRFDWYGGVASHEEEYGEAVFAKCKELNVEDMIQFHPSSRNIVDQYRECDIFCLPSSSEGYPNAICEAMSCGKPIIASRINDIPNIVQENVNGMFFNPNDVNDMADKLYQMIMLDKATFTDWGRRSREIALNLFSPENFINHYIRLIEGDRCSRFDF